MGTKSNPSKFDCYANAAPDEPLFILLGRDSMAPLLIRMWAHMRWLHGEDREKVAEALRLADDCERYRMLVRATNGVPKYDPFDWLEAFNHAFRVTLPPNKVKG